MITMIKSRWLLYRDVHCIMMQVFLYLKILIISYWAKKLMISPLVPNQLLPLISLCVLYFNKNGKKKIHVISSVDTKKALDKVQYPFMIKETRSRRKIP